MPRTAICPPTALVNTVPAYCDHYAGPVASDALGLSGIDQPGPPHGNSAPLRIVVAKPGLDGHDRGAKIVARALRDAGMEVIYTGLHQTPEQIVRTALAEDADAIGLSVLSGAHLTLFARVMELLKAERADDIVVFGGGIIPEADRALLAGMGVAAVFTPGSTMAEVVEWVRANVPKGSSATT
jgi:methylmalonyl-CoA mutase, C-terminal domain